MDNRIGSQRPFGPVLGRRLGDRSPRRERSFVLPRRPSDEEADGEEDGQLSDDSLDARDVLAPQPPPAGDSRFSVSRERLDDEAGQRLDIRG